MSPTLKHLTVFKITLNCNPRKGKKGGQLGLHLGDLPGFSVLDLNAAACRTGSSVSGAIYRAGMGTALPWELGRQILTEKNRCTQNWSRTSVAHSCTRRHLNYCSTLLVLKCSCNGMGSTRSTKRSLGVHRTLNSTLRCQVSSLSPEHP